MTPTAQRIAIAEACGWTTRETVGFRMTVWIKPDGKTQAFLPDYLSDLNAMHEAEKVIPEDDRDKLGWMLVQITDKWSTWEPHEFESLGVWEMSLWDVERCLSATAAQRAEAFLRTLGLWREG
jgi:hypothetical protein